MAINISNDGMIGNTDEYEKLEDIKSFLLDKYGKEFETHLKKQAIKRKLKDEQ